MLIGRILLNQCLFVHHSGLDSAKQSIRCNHCTNLIVIQPSCNRGNDPIMSKLTPTRPSFSKPLASVLLLFGLLLLTYSVEAQKTKVTGRVYDVETNEPLPFVNLLFKGSKIGTTTDIDGNFSIETYYATDSLVASSVGYLRLAKRVRVDEVQTVDFPLKSGSVQLGEVVIKFDKKAENPAHPIIRGVIRNKKINDREKLDSYAYETYNKIEFDVNNIDEEFKNRRVMKPFQFVFDNIDSSEAKPFLPLFMTESISEFYYRKSPKAQKEFIKATKVSGVENESVSQFLGDMYQNVNIYDNYIQAFGKSFISPVSDYGMVSYKYFLTDSSLIDDRYWCYKIHFKPRRESELTFVGDMWIHDTTYAVKQIEATISGDANINWINEFSVYQEYNQVEPEVWMLTNDRLVIDFTASNRTMGFYGRKTTSYRDFTINKPEENEFYSGIDNIVVEDSANLQSEDFWEDSRHMELSENEKNIYAMVDTIRQIPAFRTYVDILQLVVSGYKVWGNIEIGPYFTMYSFNKIEGHRFRLGGRTSNAFSTRLMLEGYSAYGTRDEQFKFGGGFQYFLSKKPRQIIGGHYRWDVEQLGQGDNAWRNDNILTSLLRRNPPTLNGYEEFKGFYDREWFNGFSNRIEFNRREIWGLGDLNFRPESPTADSRITTSEVSFHTRFAYKEKFVSGEFERVSLGAELPILLARYSLGIKDLFNGEYAYQILRVNIQDKTVINPIGVSEWLVEGGKVWGDLPYPLLELHNGNESYTYDISAFNLMNYYEFVSDEYVSVSITHHFNGLFLNKIPLMRKLKWREVASFKGVAGNLRDANKEVLPFPEDLFTLSRPYYEAGLGIENILKVIRVDALWRLSYLDNPDVTPFGIRGTLQFAF